MNTSNFQSLIQHVTGRPFVIDTPDPEIILGKEYRVYRTLPITGRNVSFKWVAPQSTEKVLRSFITAFCSKYFEPDPAAYNGCYYGEASKWENKTEEQREYAYSHHRSNMFTKDELLKQVEANFNQPSTTETMVKFAFYTTEYGIGIFSFWETTFVVNAINKLKDFLQAKSIPFTNEYSDARWVYRFKLNLNKEIHGQILSSFN